MKKLLIFLLIFISFIEVDAIPQINGISGSFEHGENITISGLGFGVKENNFKVDPSDPAPWYWENFEGSSSEFDIDSSPGLVDPEISQENPYGSSIQSLRTQLGSGIPGEAEYSSDRQGWAMYSFPEMAPGDKLFIRFWQYFSYGEEGTWCNYPNQQETMFNSQIKNWHLGSGPSGSSNPGLYGYRLLSNGFSNCDVIDRAPSVYASVSVTINGESIVRNPTWYFSGSFDSGYTALLHEKWHLWEIEMEISDVDVNDGVVRVWLSREGESQKIVDASDIYMTPVDPELYPGTGLRKIFFPFWLGYQGGGDPNPDMTSIMYEDDFYFDQSWARVVVGNNINYEDCSIREIQIPHTMWNDNNVRFEVNLGSFTQQDIDNGLYLFVVDADGNVNEDGYLITEGSGPVEPYCGDGICNGDETCETCSQDCGECPVEEPVDEFVNQTINLTPGWNLVYLNISNNNSYTSGDFNSLIVMKYDKGWEIYWNLILGESFELDPLEGYYVYSLTNRNLVFEGSPLNQDYSYSLINDSWNLFGVVDEMNFYDLYGFDLSPGELLELIYEGDSFSYNEASLLERGKLYWAKIGDVQTSPINRTYGFWGGFIGFFTNNIFSFTANIIRKVF